jgi:hypothetical protein
MSMMGCGGALAMKIKPGDLIRLRTYGRGEIERRVVGVSEKVVFVCRNEEYEEAMREGREPICVGFPMKDVLSETVMER